MKAFANHIQKNEIDEARELNQKSKDIIGESTYWFNLGIISSKEDKLSEARLSFEKSNKFQQREQTIQNLKDINEKLNVSEYEDARTISDYAIKGTHYVGNELVLTLNLLMIAIALWGVWKSRGKKMIVISSIGIILITVLSFWTKQWPWYLATKNVDIYDGPSQIFDQKGSVPNGIKILGLQKDSWIKIIYPQRLEGWIKKEDISEL